jgi:hypothetical protein
MPRCYYNPQTSEDLPNARRVNTYKNKIFTQDYFVYDNRLFKQMKNGKYRELCPQINDHELEANKYTFYFVKQKDWDKGRVPVNKLSEMTYTRS